MSIRHTAGNILKKTLPAKVAHTIGKHYCPTKLPDAAFWNKDFEDAWQEFAATEKATRKEIEQLQWLRFKEILDFAFVHVPFYQKSMTEKGISPNDIGCYEDLIKLPIVEKEDVKLNPNQFISDIKMPGAVWEQTTGSSGAPTNLFNSTRHVAIRSAIVRRYRRLAGFDCGDPYVLINRMSFADNAEAEAFHGWYSLTQNNLFFASTNMMPSVMKEYVRKIKEFKPCFIEGYSSAVYVLATYILENNLDVRVPVIISRTDQLYPKYKDAIARAFQTQNIYGYYGNVEQVASASDCYLHRGKHINMEACLVETLDKNGKQVWGQEGEVIGTNLVNKAMVFIRYRLGDQITLSKDICGCGRESYLITSLHGRTDDLLNLANGRKMAGASLWFCAVDLFGIREFQLVQKSPDHVIVNYSKYPDCSLEEVEKLAANIREHLGEDIKIETVEHDIVPRINGKFKFIVRAAS